MGEAPRFDPPHNHGDCEVWQGFAPLEQEVTLRHGQDRGRLAGQQHPIGAHLVGFGVHVDDRSGGVELHGRSADAGTGIAHRQQLLVDPQPPAQAGIMGGLGDEYHR